MSDYRFTDTTVPPPSPSKKTKLEYELLHTADGRSCLLKGRVQDPSFPPFTLLNALLMICGGELETIVPIQNLHNFSVIWKMPERHLAHTAALYYMPTQHTLLVSAVHVVFPP